MQKILVVDDSPMNRELLDEILKDDYPKTPSVFSSW